MIRIRIIAPGKDKDEWVTLGSHHYIKLLSRYARVELVVLPSLKLSSSLSPDEIRKKEAVPLSKQLRGGYCVALSDSGKKYDSRAFADFVEKRQVAGNDAIEFIVGGPYGLDNDLLNQADTVLSLSSLTFPHKLVRLILLEQLYRAFSILHNTSYHK